MRKKEYLPKTFTLEYLAENELTEDDLYYIFEEDSLFYSLVKEMFEYAPGERMTFRAIYDKIHNNDEWVTSSHFRNRKEQQDFIQRGTRAIKNVYYISDRSARRAMQNFMTRYGFSVK